MNETFTVSNKDGEEQLNPTRNELSFQSSSSDNSAAEEDQVEPVSASSKQPKLPFFEMVIAAVKDCSDSKGATVQSIKSFMKTQYGVEEVKMKRYLKKSVERCLKEELIVRCKTKGVKESAGMLGRFKMNPEKVKAGKKKVQKAPATKPPSLEKKKKKAKPKPNIGKEERSHLKSLRRKSSSVLLAQNKLKQARKSLAELTPKKLKNKRQLSKAKVPTLSVEARPRTTRQKAKEMKEEVVAVGKNKPSEGENQPKQLTKSKKKVDEKATQEATEKPKPKVPKKKPKRK